MIFNEMMNSSVSIEAVQESPYELGVGGALMHVYENECNYNALMKAAALSEMRYFSETGGDLFVQEAGAFGGFIQKAKDFFKKVIEKIKAIFKKFVAVINQYTMKDKDFVKKYEKDLNHKILTDFEFDGYKFANLDDYIKKSESDIANGENDITLKVGLKYTSTQDEIDKVCETNRGKLIGITNGVDENEFRDELHDVLYGDDKETLENIKIRDWLGYITDTNKNIKDVEKVQKKIERTVNDIIKSLDKKIDTKAKELKDGKGKMTDGAADIELTGITKQSWENSITLATKQIEVCKTYCNDLTVYFGAVVAAVKDRNRQAKAICVKALSYKHEAASLYSESYSEYDIFSGVEII